MEKGLPPGALRSVLAAGLEYSALQDEWSFPLEAALDGLDWSQAAWRPEGGMGIWDIALHLAVWNENIVQRVLTNEKCHPSEPSWPELPEPTPANWEAAKERLRQSIGSLKTLIETEDEARLLANGYGAADILCRFIHLAYHAGQIVKIRECQGWILEGQ